MAKFRKGEPRPEGAGRKPGSRNRTTVAAKQAIIEALNHGPGATAYMLRLKNSKVAEDRRSFVYLVGKLIPREVHADVELNENVGRVVVVLPDNGRGPINGESVEEFRRRIGESDGGGA